MFLLNFTRDTINMPELNATKVSIDIGIFYCQVIAYIVIGVILIVANTPILVNIIRHTVLRARKEYLLFAGLACADMLAGWGTLSTGAYRLKLIKWHEENNQVSRLYCIGTPTFILPIFSGTVQASMLVIISIDRFIAIIWPLKYVTFTRLYSVIMVASCYLLSVLYTTMLMVYLHIVDSKTPSTMNAVCLIGKVHGMFDSVFYVRLFMATISVVVYIVVWFLFRRYQRITVTSFPNAIVHLRRTQRRLTITVGICALFTFIFYVIPTALMFTGLKEDFWAPFYWIINSFNAVTNVFVYSLRHKDIRLGLRLLFTCEEMPTQAIQRLRKESMQSYSATAKAALVALRHVGVVLSTSVFRKMRTANMSTSNANAPDS